MPGFAVSKAAQGLELQRDELRKSLENNLLSLIPTFPQVSAITAVIRFIFLN